MPCNEFEALLKKQQIAVQEKGRCRPRIYGKKLLLIADEDQQYRNAVRKKTLKIIFEVLEAPDAKKRIGLHRGDMVIKSW